MRFFSAIALLCVLASNALADDIAKLDLIERLEAYQTITANFEQRTYRDNNLAVEQSTGRLQIEKPMKFSWIVSKPFEQQVISDGDTLWVYDPDLEQATYQPIASSVEQSPAMILAQPRRALAEKYDVRLATSDDLNVYRLTPRDPESVFEELTLLFEKDVIQELRIKDSLGQETVVTLSDVQYDPPIDPEIFNFTPPPGTDLFEQAQ